MHLRVLSRVIIVAVIVGVYIVLAFSGALPKSVNLLQLSFINPLNKGMVVKEVREIGELTTAQFYGEVFADLNSIQKNIVEQHNGANFPDSLLTAFPKLPVFAKLYVNQKTADSLLSGKNKQVEQLEQFIDTLKLRYKQEVHTFINEKSRELAIKKIEKYEKELETERDKLPRLVWLAKNSKERFADFQHRRNLIYIGRGKVRAGFDFSAILENYVGIQNSYDTVSIILPPPKILNADINPWYLQDKIKGYELFDEFGGPFTNEEIRSVRLMCLKELEKQALKKGIMKLATENGRNTFKNLFGSLGYSELKIKFEQKVLENSAGKKHLGGL